MTKGNPGIDQTIDVSQVSMAVSAVQGMVQGVEESGVTIVSKIQKGMEQSFSETADYASIGENAPLSHVYEYGLEGSAAGRLWVMDWTVARNSAKAAIAFRPAVMVSPIDPRLEEHALLKGVKMATHVFTDKASVLEHQPFLESVAGQTPHSERRGGGDTPTKLVFWSTRRGKPMFTKAMARENKYHGNFQKFIADFYAIGEMEEKAESQMNQAERNIESVKADIQRAVKRIPFDMKVAKGQGTRIVSMGRPGGVQIIASVVKQFKATTRNIFKRGR